MRVINADAMKKRIDDMYNEALGRRDTEMQKVLVVAHGIVDTEPTVDVEYFNGKYKGLPEEQRKAVDMLLDCLVKENERRKNNEQNHV